MFGRTSHRTLRLGTRAQSSAFRVKKDFDTNRTLHEKSLMNNWLFGLHLIWHQMDFVISRSPVRWDLPFLPARELSNKARATVGSGGDAGGTFKPLSSFG
jgi:hypothetical protein